MRPVEARLESAPDDCCTIRQIIGFTVNFGQHQAAAQRKFGHFAEAEAARELGAIVAGSAQVQSCDRRAGPVAAVCASSSRRAGATGKTSSWRGRVTPAQAAAGGWLLDQPYLLLALTSLFWAGNTILGRFIVGHVPPMTLAFIRWSGAFVILLPFAAAASRARLAGHPQACRPDDAARAHRHLRLQHAWPITVCSTRRRSTDCCCNRSGRFVVAMWTFALFGERLTLRQAAGICVSLSGVIVIICHGSLAVLIGITFNRATCGSSSPCSSTASTRRCCASGHRSIRCRFLVGRHGRRRVLADSRGGRSRLPPGRTMIARPESFLSFVFVVHLSVFARLPVSQSRHRADRRQSRRAVYRISSPVFGSVMAIVFLGEQFQLYHAIGYGLVFAGITVATRK